MSTRKSFVLHKDSLQVLDDLSDEQAGKLFKAIKAIQLGEDFELDSLTKIALSPFKAQFARDNEKYERIVERNKNNGLKGGRPKTEDNPEEPKKPSGLITNPENPQKADSVSKSDSVSDSDNKRSILAESQIPVDELISIYNEECNALPKIVTYNKKQKRISQLKARWNEDKERQNLDWWREFFRWCNTNESLNGSKFDWIADLEAITNQSKFTRLIEKGTL